MQSTRLLLGCLVAALLFTTSGCGGPEIAPVSGKITVGGQPVGRGSVTFMPDQDKGTSGKVAVGDIQSDGSYSLRTFDTDDGALVGHHRVIISGRGLEDAENMAPDPNIPPRYANPAQSGLTAEVKSGSNPINFDLTP